MLVAEALGDSSLSPRARLQRYFHIITGRLEADGFARGCLIGDLSLEASGSSKLLRTQLDDIFAEWRQPFAACIRAGQASGELADDFDASELAEFLLASWQGAMLRMKVERSPAALERFKAIAFQTVFKEPSRTTGTVGGAQAGFSPTRNMREVTMSDVSITYCRPCGYEQRAKEAAAALRERFAIDAKLVPGTGGVFEVKVGDRIVAKRARGHFPDTSEVVAAVAAARG